MTAVQHVLESNQAMADNWGEQILDELEARHVIPVSDWSEEFFFGRSNFDH